MSISSGRAYRPRSPRKTSFNRWLGLLYSEYRWHFIGALWVTALVLGYSGFKGYAVDIGIALTPPDILYRALQLFVLESGAVESPLAWQLQVARFLAPAVTLYTAVEVLAVVLRDQVKNLRLRFLCNHVVICGLGRKGILLVEAFADLGAQVVAIERDAHNLMLGRSNKCGAITLVGSAVDSAMLRKARVDKARYLISVCGDDGTNSELAMLTGALALRPNTRSRALVCLIHIVDPRLCRLLKEQEMKIGRPDAFRLEFFNVFESGVRVLLSEYPPFSNSDADIGSEPHVAIVGVGHFGESMVLNVAKKWRDRRGRDGLRLRITLIDDAAQEERQLLYLRNPGLETVCDLIPKEVNTNSPDFERGDFLMDEEGLCDITVIYVCLDNDTDGLTAALKLEQRLRPLDIPITVRMTQDSGLATLLRGEEQKGGVFGNVHGFGLLDHTCTPDLILEGTYETLARAFHEEYVRNEVDKGATSQINPSLVPWEKLPESLKESNRGEAEHIRAKLEAIGCDVTMTSDWNPPLFEFSREEIEEMARMEHERFVRERLHAGWVYGDAKDLAKRISPTLVPWNELSEEEKEVDRNLIRVLPRFLARVGFQIHRSRIGMRADAMGHHWP